VKLRIRLARLESLARANEPEPETAPSSRRWLGILDLLLGFARKKHWEEAATAPLREAAELLRGYVNSGCIGAHTEDYCGCKLNVFSAWYHAKPGESWHGVPCPVRGDEAERLRQRLQIDAWRAAAPADAERLQQLVSKNMAIGL
jgi:hypothetical protein